MMKNSDRASLVARKTSLTALVPTVDARMGSPPFKKVKLDALFPFDRYCWTWGTASLKVEMR
jgi:hypothetical protein